MLLVPNPPYLHLEPFARVAGELRRRGVEAALLALSGGAVRDELRRTGLPVEAVRLARRRPGRGAIPERLLRLADLVAARRLLERALERLAPGVVVVGSDLGDAFVRLLLDRCRLRPVPVLVLATVPSGPAPGDLEPPPHGGRAARSLLAVAGLGRVPFRGHVYGSYCSGAAIAVPSEAYRRDLLASGIDPARIAVTGNPRHDRLAGIRERRPEDVRRELGLVPGVRLVLYCTERIHEIHGRDYLARLDGRLRESFDRVPGPLRVVVKLHPGEDDRSAAGFRERFRGPRYHVVADGDVHLLARAADLVLGHYSEVLADAVLLGRPVLSLHLRPDPRLPGHLEVPEIASEDEITPRLREALERAGPAPPPDGVPDGLASARVADRILELLGAGAR